MSNTKTCRGCVSSRQRVRTTPIVKDDGSLLFKKVAPALAGYVHDTHNPKRLIPDAMPCTERITLPVLDNGSYWIMNRCNHIDCLRRGQDVNREICGSCPDRKTHISRQPLQ
jgi:hypothetical protein